MTRLADALTRAKLRPQDTTEAPTPISSRSSRRRSRSRSMLPTLPPVSALDIDEPVVAPVRAAADGPALIGPAMALPHLDAWRRDPDLVGKLVSTDSFPQGAHEQYRKIAATLHHAQLERDIQVIMAASSLPSEGKSLTAINLALTLSDSYRRRVLLIDADLRRPTVQRMFRLETIDGLDEGLKAEHDRAMPILQITESLFVLAAGRPDPDPVRALTSERMRRLIAQARAQFDWVVLDTPPVTLLPDAHLLAKNVDGVLLVVRAGKAPYQLVKRTVETIGHDQILGVIMNAVDYRHDRNAGGYYEYYGYGYYGVPKK
jgi:capsular exopolysaccharide synthesis family protein